MDGTEDGMNGMEGVERMNDGMERNRTELKRMDRMNGERNGNGRTE